MLKFNVKNLATTVFLGMLLFGVIGIASAQQALPKGGDSFGTAVKLEPGNYQGGSLESREVEYFYVADIKPGQEIKIKGTFTAGSTTYGANCILYLCDEDRVELGGAMEAPYGTPAVITVSWLSNSDKDTYKYYIKTGSDYNKLASHSLEISITDCFDVSSRADAGDSFEKSISIAPGEYTSYLSGEMGTDAKDFYKLSVQKGTTLTVKATPEGEARMRVVVYDNNRRILKDEYAPNPGAIITNSVPITKTGDVFAAVVCDKYCSNNIISYTLNITAEEGVAGEGVKEGVSSDMEEGAFPGVEGTEDIAEAEDIAETVGKGIASAIIFWIVGPIILLVIIGIVAYFLSKKKKKI